MATRVEEVIFVVEGGWLVGWLVVVVVEVVAIAVAGASVGLVGWLAY